MEVRGGRHAAVAGELVEWWEDVCLRGIGSRVVLVAVPPGWGRSTVLDHLAEVTGGDDGPVTLVARINGKALRDGTGLQAAVLRACLAEAGGRHRPGESLGLDRVAGAAQLGLGVGTLFVPGLAAGVSFLAAGLGGGAAGKAWDDSPAGQDGAVARAARAVAAVSVSVPVVVIIDDADCVDLGLAVTVVENLIARHNSQVLVVAAVNPGSALAVALTSRSRFGLTEGLVTTADTDPDMGERSRAELVRELCPDLPGVAVRRIARRTGTFAEVFAAAAAPRLGELSPDDDEAAVDAVINALLPPGKPSDEAVVVAWAGGLMHARQASRALEILTAGRHQDAGPHDAGRDVLRWESLARLADPAWPRLAEQVAALSVLERQAMAAVVLEEALAIGADPAAGLVDRVAGGQAAHRVRDGLPAGGGGPPAPRPPLAAPCYG